MTDKIHTTFGTLAKFYECYYGDNDYGDNDTPVTVAKDAETGEWRVTAHTEEPILEGGDWAPSSDEQAAELAAFVEAGN